MPYTSRSGLNLYYEVIGNCKNDIPIVFHHGFGNSVANWKQLGYVDKLSSTFPLILFDGRGFGKSDKPYDPKSYSPELIAKDCLAVLDEVGIRKCHLFGNSMGGIVGLMMSQIAPERYCSFCLTSTIFAARRQLSLPLSTIIIKLAFQ